MRVLLSFVSAALCLSVPTAFGADKAVPPKPTGAPAVVAAPVQAKAPGNQQASSVLPTPAAQAVPGTNWYQTADGRWYVWHSGKWVLTDRVDDGVTVKQVVVPPIARNRRFSTWPSLFGPLDDGPGVYGRDWYLNGRGYFSD